MPVVVVTGLADHDVAAELPAVARALADALGQPPEGVWVYWQPAAAVALGERLVGHAGHCPVVVVRGRARDEATVAAGLTAVAYAVAAALRVPLEDVWATWVEVEPGRVFAGGALLA